MYDAFGDALEASSLSLSLVAFLHIIRGESDDSTTSKKNPSLPRRLSQPPQHLFNDGALSGLPRLTRVIIGFDSRSNTLTHTPTRNEGLCLHTHSSFSHTHTQSKCYRYYMTQRSSSACLCEILFADIPQLIMRTSLP